jgi:asparagine synthase (glutamine-hydrolysing)
MKHFLKDTFAQELPRQLLDRRDKMGFPVPLKEWFAGPLRDFVHDIFRSERGRTRPYLNADAILANLNSAERFSRKAWGLLSLELWHQNFHDRAAEFRQMVDAPPPAAAVEAAAMAQ